MENVAKAISIAGGVLISLILVTLIVILFKQVGTTKKKEQDALLIEQIEKYTRQLKIYNRHLYGSELLSLANLVEDFNNKLVTKGLYNTYGVTVLVTMKERNAYTTKQTRNYYRRITWRRAAI